MNRTLLTVVVVLMFILSVLLGVYIFLDKDKLANENNASNETSNNKKVDNKSIEEVDIFNYDISKDKEGNIVVTNKSNGDVYQAFSIKELDSPDSYVDGNIYVLYNPNDEIELYDSEIYGLLNLKNKKVLTGYENYSCYREFDARVEKCDKSNTTILNRGYENQALVSLDDFSIIFKADGIAVDGNGNFIVLSDNKYELLDSKGQKLLNDSYDFIIQNDYIGYILIKGDNYYYYDNKFNVISDVLSIKDKYKSAINKDNNERLHTSLEIEDGYNTIRYIDYINDNKGDKHLVFSFSGYDEGGAENVHIFLLGNNGKVLFNYDQIVYSHVFKFSGKNSNDYIIKSNECDKYSDKIYCEENKTLYSTYKINSDSFSFLYCKSDESNMYEHVLKINNDKAEITSFKDKYKISNLSMLSGGGFSCPTYKAY